MNQSEFPPSLWHVDLINSRSLTRQEISGFELLLSWFENWRVRQNLPANREVATHFWKTAILSKQREHWQLQQWGCAIAWYLEWIDHAQKMNKQFRSVAECMSAAVHTSGARRGLARTTRKSYASWVARYGVSVNNAKEVMKPERAREWLASLVTETKISYATQKQALNALAFFFKDVCGLAEVDLGVKFRKRNRHIPVVLSKKEVFELIEKIEPKYRLQAQLQYGAGLRLKELVNLRIKDVDIDRRQLMIRAGKGNKDRVTVIPESLSELLKNQVERCWALYDRDRQAEKEGVAAYRATPTRLL